MGSESTLTPLMRLPSSVLSVICVSHWWRDLQQAPHEEVRHLAYAVRAAVRVTRARNHEQVEHLVRLDERVHHLERRGRIDIRVELTDHEQQVALQLVRVVDVR